LQITRSVENRNDNDECGVVESTMEREFIFPTEEQRPDPP